MGDDLRVTHYFGIHAQQLLPWRARCSPGCSPGEPCRKCGLSRKPSWACPCWLPEVGAPTSGSLMSDLCRSRSCRGAARRATSARTFPRSSRWTGRKSFSRRLKPSLANERAVELRAPGGRVRVRLRAHDVAFPEVWTRRVPLGRDPRIEHAPGGGEAFVGP